MDKWSQQFSAFIYSAQGRQLLTRLPVFFSFALIILIANSVAGLTWHIFTIPVEQSAPPITKPVLPDKTETIRLNNLANLHLFGEANKAQPVVQKVIDAPETRLRLTLKGVFASSDEKKALAIISGDKGADKAYRIGDQVVGGALLHAVFADRVILKRNNQLETLRLPKPKMGAGEIVRETSSQSPHGVDSSVVLEPASDSAAEQLNELRETLQQDPQKLWEQVRITPVMDNDQIQGYRLEHNDAGLMQSLNLRPTDVVVAVNGMTLSDPSTLYGLMNELNNQQQLELSIIRDGQPQTISLSF